MSTIFVSINLMTIISKIHFLPIDEWLRGPLRGWADDLLSSDNLGESGLLEPDPIARAWTAVKDGRGSGISIWAILMFQAWKDHWC